MPQPAPRSGFPANFVWGAASSSYQIEGGAAPAARGANIWDSFCRQPGAVYAGHTGDEACDHYHRFAEDVQLMRQIGLRAYRLSIAWPRVLPTGAGPANGAGLEFYERLIDALLAAGVQPWVTLYHWDLPEALQARGGWCNREIVGHFADYATLVVERLGDRVAHWITLNEPQIFIGQGLRDGTHAPGLKLPQAHWLLAAHHALLAHGRGVQAIRAASKQPCRIGWAPAVRVEYPASDSPGDIDAARRMTLGVLKSDAWNTAWFAEPIYFGRYPQDGLRLFGADAPAPRPGDMELINQPTDFLGVNIYSGTPATMGPDGVPVNTTHPPGHARTTMNWPVSPAALHWGPRFLHERYRVPIFITENGMANADWLDLEGRVRDPQRIDYTRRYLLALQQAIAAGTDVRGYFHWSIMDNFEWAEGYNQRFGLVYVDFQTQKRTWKDSAHWYRAVIASNGGTLHVPPERALGESLVC